MASGIFAILYTFNSFHLLGHTRTLFLLDLFALASSFPQTLRRPQEISGVDHTISVAKVLL
jgi:hypothetical protein